jgi:hypothetical protein
MRTDLNIECDHCERPAKYHDTPSNPEAPTTYVCGRHTYSHPTTDFTRLPTVSLVKPVNLVKRTTLRPDELVKHGIPANANGKHRRLIRAI